MLNSCGFTSLLARAGLALLLFAGTTSAQEIKQKAANTPAAADYYLGVGDAIKIEVHEEPDLTVETELRANGTINYPFIGQINAAGLSLTQLEKLITEGLKGGYLLSPEVRVRVTSYRPFYVNGQVKKPGGYPYIPGLTVEKAIATAGGLTDRASERRIYLQKEKSHAPDNRINVGLDEVIGPGDTVFVDEGIF